MTVVTIEEAKASLSRLVDEAVGGGEVIIARWNKPLVKLVPVAEARPPRRLGTAAGKIRISDDFDDPLPELDGFR